VARAVVGSPHDLRVCRVGRIWGSDVLHAGLMTQGLSIVQREPRLARQDVRRPGIARPVTSVGDKPPFGAPNCDFRVVGNSVGNSVGNFFRHPAQMPPAPREGFAPQRVAVGRPFLSPYGAGRALWRRGPFTRGPLLGGAGDGDRPQARGAGLSRRAEGKQRRCA
jgi:hypothetical protein